MYLADFSAWRAADTKRSISVNRSMAKPALFKVDLPYHPIITEIRRHSIGAMGRPCGRVVPEYPVTGMR